ncbi:dienelactone hydrolase family protein [Protaetiibacter mangrovi]|uniref:Dienelactone hydrolase family protein n=1 Tax=Protaetiibacter mangrovi TaxID=2970926 RepID=A0ABT1ZGV2_9MICO|nr:dienelactone hydrolase family protein [Protaetiibacter mangrovi]MCS0499825.1 dienelactone hydrolase family protein [Protaetiibacter mangrovi]TPX02957.1 dienelactone hydrolase family protein [Schumannella luteola]
MIDDIVATRVEFPGWRGDEIPGYLARPSGDGSYPIVVVLHHRDGWDRESKEIARRFATEGYACILPHLHHRSAPGEAPEVAAKISWDAGGVPMEQLIGDVEGALAYLGAQPFAAAKRGIIGYCSGGRQSFLASTRIPFDATVVCYGPKIDTPPADLTDANPVSPLSLAGDLVGPVLGLFGDDDRNPTPEAVGAVDAELTRLGKEHRFVSYPGAGHAFFAVNLPAYRWEAAMAGWAEVDGWFDRLLRDPR